MKKIGINKYLDKLLSYLIALRPWTFGSTLSPVLLGTVLSYKYGKIRSSNINFDINTKNNLHFDPIILVLILLITISVHGAGNLVNTYYDYTTGFDKLKDITGSQARDRTLLDNIITPNEVVNLAGFLYLFGCLGLSILVCISPARLEHLALVYFGGISGSFLYTGGAMGLKYFTGLGDLVAMLIFGPVCTIFAFLAQTPYNDGLLQQMPYLIIYSLPLFFWTESVLHSNNANDAFNIPSINKVDKDKICDYNKSSNIKDNIGSGNNNYNPFTSHVNTANQKGISKKNPNSIVEGTKKTKNVFVVSDYPIIVTTFATIIGPFWSIYFYAFVLLIPYVIFLYFAYIYSFWFLFPTLTVNKAFNLISKFKYNLKIYDSNNKKQNYINLDAFLSTSQNNSVQKVETQQYIKTPLTCQRVTTKNFNFKTLSPFANTSLDELKSISFNTAQLNLESAIFYALACYLTPLSSGLFKIK